MRKHPTDFRPPASQPEPVRRLWTIAAGATVAAFGQFSSISVGIAAELPVPCAAGSCGVTGPQTWITAGSAGLVQVGNSLTVTQNTENATFNWHSFNISSDGAVTFKQPDAAAVALNQIFQADPSKILGALNANGSVYLINQNGIIFGAGAQINIGSLLASTLNISPDALNGILQPALKGNPAFTSFLDANGNPTGGSVQVLPGAKINAPNGQIFLFGQNVTNEGSLRADGGQVILAAGDSVYLAASTDPNLRGLLVEVGKGGTATNAAASTAGGSDYGQITADDGDVTMVGLIVNQLGRVSATTAVQENGSIHLLAQEGGTAQYLTGAIAATLSATHAGTLTLGADSQTDVNLDLASTSTAVDSTAQPKSQVILSGQQVTLAGASEITAPSGNVSITAAAVPEQSPQFYAANPGSGRLVIDPNASINVAGANISLPMSSNVIAVQLRGTELADSPLQRNGPLYGQTVYIDTRQSGTLADGTPWVGSPIGNLFGYVSTVARTVGARNLTGGTITLNSDGAVFVAPQATLNVAGGSIDYRPGYIDTTKLLGTNSQVYDISQAYPNQSYAGIVSNYSVTDPKWGVTTTYPSPGSADPRGQFEPGYLEGKDAGTVTIAAPRLVLDGNIDGSTIVGPNQRQMPNTTLYPSTTGQFTQFYRPINQIPVGGTLVLGDAGGGIDQNNYLLPNVVFASGAILDSLTGPTGAPFDPLNDPLPSSLQTVQLRPDLFAAGGISRLDIYANGTVTIPPSIALNLPDAGQLNILAGAIADAGSVTAHSGSVSLLATPTQAIPPDSPDATLTLAATGQIDVSGRWINDQPAINAAPSTDPLAISGGSVLIASAGGTPVDLRSGSFIDVSGGAQRAASGKISGGKAGGVSITIGPSTGGIAVASTVASTLRAYGLTQGGRFSLKVNALCIAATDCSDGQTGLVWIPPTLFSSDGFSSIALASNIGGIDVAAGTQIHAQELNYGINGDPSTTATGTAFDALATPLLLPDFLRSPVNVSFSVSPSQPSGLAFDETAFATAGILNIERGASITLDPTGALALSSTSSILIDGNLSAPAGSLTIATTTGLPLAGFLDSQGIWLESDATLSTRGVALLQANDLGQRTGTVLNGGNISIAANRGYLFTALGSSIDASGTAAQVDLAQYTSVGGVLSAVPKQIGSNGGTISLSAAEGLFLTGSAVSRAGNAPGAAGGALDITLDGNRHGQEPSFGAALFPLGPRQLIVSGGAPLVVAPQSPVPNQYDGLGLVPSALLTGGGFSTLQLSAKNLFDSSYDQGNSPVSTASIVFAQDTNLQLPASIRLDTPLLVDQAGAQVQLAAPYVGIGYSDTAQNAQTGSAIAPGSGSLLVQGSLVDFIGTLGLSGFSTSTINSSGDIRFEGVETSGQTQPRITGSLLAEGNLTLQAQQLYPTTLSQYTVSVAGAAQNDLSIQDAGGTAAPLLSAGGQLTLQADAIDQAGVLRAPFGELVLDAPSITLTSGSVTSVSGAGQTIPFGSTQAGTDWVYTLPLGENALFTQTGPPAKSVQLNGHSIVVAKGATIDLSGGGDLQASEFVPGVGGTVDVLSSAYTAFGNQFAIVPTLSLAYAPYDPQSQAGFAYAPGSSVVLAGGGGIAAGTYAILPASYALLPGAYLVQPVSGYTDLAAGQTIARQDGSTIIAGQFAVAGTSSSLTGRRGSTCAPAPRYKIWRSTL